MASEPLFFDFAAEVGLTKHIGGLKATEAIIECCHIEPGSVVLDVGCGVGTTAVLLAHKHGCRVAGIDIRQRMVERSRERARKAGMHNQAEFQVADVEELPFADGTFDAVISESVTSFPQDKRQALSEYVRVTKSGGFIGLNESVWLRTPVPTEILAWVAQDAGAAVEALTKDQWVELLQGAGLSDIVAQSYEVNTGDEARSLVARYGLREALGIVGRMLALYARSPAYRAFVKSTRESGVIPPNLEQYFGYGLFVGRK